MNTNHAERLARWNEKYFASSLPPAKLELLEPLDVKGRHELIERYLADNRWYSVRPGDRLLDVGCGFPPLTSVDLATRFSHCTVIGVDPGGKVDVVRSMNALIYFDTEFRRRALDWIGSLLNDGGLFVCGMNWARGVNSRYSIYQKEADALAHREFAFGLECVRPLEMVPLYAFYDEEVEFALQRECVRTLRSDETFLQLYDAHLDALQKDSGLCPRGPDGHLGGLHEDLAPEDLEEGLVAVASGANSEELVAAACAVLSHAGHHAWRNEAGHLAITPPCRPEK